MDNCSSEKNKKLRETRRTFLQKISLGTAALGITGSALKTNLWGATPAKTISSFEKSANEHTGSKLNTISKEKYDFKYVVGIVGNPAYPDISWSDDELIKIKDLGVNMLQLSIAWGGKPANEVLNLEDLDQEQIKKWEFRVKQAKKFGFSTIAQFGVPKLLYTANAYSVVQPACILDPEVRKKYSTLLANFLKKFPTVDNILLYTYDQNAWLCSEFGPCPRCSGIPLHERLVGFLDYLKDSIREVRSDVRLWWKPWEISNGTTITIAKAIIPENFGLVINPSSANEVYPLNDRAYKSDLGIRRTVQVAHERGIPVIGEIDYTFYQGYNRLSDYFPRLVHEQLQGWRELEGVVGVKEYFGFSPAQFSVNAAMLKACLQSPNSSVDELLDEISIPYGKEASKFMKQAWEYMARGVEAYPWDITPSFVGLSKGDNGSHSWEPVTISNDTWATPAWKTNRKAYFMLANNSKAHPWIFEDMGLLLNDSANLFENAVTYFDKALRSSHEGTKKDIETQRDNAAGLARGVKSYALHFQETLAAQDARLVGYDPKQWRIVINRLDTLLESDVKNQNGAKEVVQKLQEFQKDPRSWLNSNLNPLAYESKATIDWTKFVPFQNKQV